MSDRIAIKKSVRFEVFKRDGFKCQYCGRFAPEVVLHVDHIAPVAEGGDNNIMNLITSCADCNLGKGAKRLDDSSAVSKQARQMQELNERREQLEMMIEWREGLGNIKKREFEIFENAFSEIMNSEFTEKGKKLASRIVQEYGLPEALEALNIASNQDLIEGQSLSYIKAICRNRKVDNEKPYLRDLFYIRKILMVRLHDYNRHSREAIAFLEQAYLDGVTIQDMTLEAKMATWWDDFESAVDSNRG